MLLKRNPRKTFRQFWFKMLEFGLFEEIHIYHIGGHLGCILSKVCI